MSFVRSDSCHDLTSYDLSYDLAGMTVSSVYRVIKKAKDREYNKNESSIMKMKYSTPH